MNHAAIDLGGKESQICIRHPDGTIVEERKLPTRKLVELVATWSPSRVVMETSAEAFRIADAAIAAGHPMFRTGVDDLHEVARRCYPRLVRDLSETKIDGVCDLRPTNSGPDPSVGCPSPVGVAAAKAANKGLRDTHGHDFCS